MGEAIRILEKQVSASFSGPGNPLCTIVLEHRRPTGRVIVTETVQKLFAHNFDARSDIRRHDDEVVDTTSVLGAWMRSAETGDRDHTLDRAVEAATNAVQNGTVLMFWGDQQIEDLDRPLPAINDAEATFIRLIPLRGG